MKRSWVGFLLLLILLILSLAVSRGMARIHEDASRKLEQAADLALRGDWAGAAFRTAQVRHSWDNWELLRGALADHGPIEALDTDFAALEFYCRRRELLSFAALCREMAKQMEAMGDAHGWDLKNIL